MASSGVGEVVRGEGVAVQAADGDLAEWGLDYWGSISVAALDCGLLLEFDPQDVFLVALEKIFVVVAPGLTADVAYVARVAEGHDENWCLVVHELLDVFC